MFKGDEKTQSFGGSRYADLTALHRSDPLFIMQEYMTNLVSKGREGGRENKTIDLQLKMDSEQLFELFYGDVRLLVSQ